MATTPKNYQQAIATGTTFPGQLPPEKIPNRRISPRTTTLPPPPRHLLQEMCNGYQGNREIVREPLGMSSSLKCYGLYFIGLTLELSYSSKQPLLMKHLQPSYT